ncbi:response regulator [Pantanalinema rosaneae CENA516]|uniref:response regulator n=1 Tax=Pantanalinema rosaneae TaxID=1620701 RepID=UPI003D6F5E0E
MTRPPLILVVDDNEDHLLLVRYVLESLEFEFIGETDSQVALQIAKSHCPDLILLDIMLPTLSGLEVIQYLQADPLTQEIPVIAVTALARKEDRERMLQAGFVDYISKPYMLDELEAVIQRQLSSIKASDLTG